MARHNKKPRTRRPRARKNGGAKGSSRNVGRLTGGEASSSSGLSVMPRLRGLHELKYATLDLTANFNQIKTNVTSNLELSTLIAQGTGLNNRVGNEVLVKYVEFVGQLVGGQANTVADDARNVVRLTLVSAIIGTIWSAANYSTTKVLEKRTISGLMHVYYDELISLNTPGRDTTGYLPACTMFSRRVRVNKRMSWFAASGGATPVGLALVGSSDSSIVPFPGFTSGTLVIAFEDA
jgi:hypothetical protein